LFSRRSVVGDGALRVACKDLWSSGIASLFGGVTSCLKTEVLR